MSTSANTHTTPSRMNKKSSATQIATQREEILVRYFNQDAIFEDELKCFPCSIEAFQTLSAQLLSAEPTFLASTKAGGLGKHVDLHLVLQSESIPKGVEVKVSDKTIRPDLLEWQPWEGGVQFLQGQIVSARMLSFLGDCGLPMLAAWFEKVKEFMALRTPELEVPTLDDYKKLLFTIGSEKKLTTPAAKLIQSLRANEALRSDLQQRWLNFETAWFSTHTPNVVAFQQALKEVLEEKDYWMNINKAGAFLIEGFHVTGLRYVETHSKPEGGSVFRYVMTLQKKKSKATKEVPIVLKFYWKNGGQGVQNINLLVVSDPFA